MDSTLSLCLQEALSRVPRSHPRCAEAENLRPGNKRLVPFRFGRPQSLDDVEEKPQKLPKK